MNDVGKTVRGCPAAAHTSSCSASAVSTSVCTEVVWLDAGVGDGEDQRVGDLRDGDAELLGSRDRRPGMLVEHHDPPRRALLGEDGAHPGHGRVVDDGRVVGDG